MSQQAEQPTLLNRHVQRLEARVAQLHASLEHHQQWYWDYAALHEEVDNVPREPKDEQRKELARIRRDFDGHLLKKKELNEIFGKNDLREPAVISSHIARRIDYVEKSIGDLNKLIETEENRLAAAEVVANPDRGVDEETGLPIMDIYEELDDDDNVTFSELRGAGSAGPQVVEALKKLGIKDKDLSEIAGKDKEADTDRPAKSAETPKDEKKEEEKQKDEPVTVKEVTPLVSTSQDASSTSSQDVESGKYFGGTKKQVSFAHDTKPGDEEAELPKSQATLHLEEMMQKAKELDAMDMSKAAIPDNESAEDAALRREMLDYSMSEIGPVVAELELDDGSFDEDEDWDDDFDDLDDEDDIDEDEFGRSQHSVITDDYIKRMQELEKRLRVKSAFTASTPDSKIPEGNVGRIAVFPEVTPPGEAADNLTPETKQKAPKGKKGVRFAPELDIAEEKEFVPAPKPKAKKPAKKTIGNIVEKQDALAIHEDEEEEEEEPPKRVSRFKKELKAFATTTSGQLPPGPHQLPVNFFANQVHPDPIPEPLAPEGKPLADAVVERNVSSEPKEPGDVDDALVYQAAAVEYNRLRNRMIQKEGGFMKEVERPTLPLDEEEGGPPRMSKFKAARLARS
ncbi:Prefoldin subunit-domain-containing protein [Apodospora peruviana]|uniref:Prefoldin subunit-domain-containing protein n=1 Tax=Apodospora peruviana TaxID=516989 RepID=A0AAE0ISA6_9PEZI|nr:Prefoldin subunit-domain-containing protein [Apodospora peruviana]